MEEIKLSRQNMLIRNCSFIFNDALFSLSNDNNSTSYWDIEIKQKGIEQAESGNMVAISQEGWLRDKKNPRKDSIQDAGPKDIYLRSEGAISDPSRPTKFSFHCAPHTAKYKGLEDKDCPLNLYPLSKTAFVFVTIL